MRKKGKRTAEYFAVARHSGKSHPYDTDLLGRESKQEAAEDLRKEYGGHVVRVTETVSWEPVVPGMTWKRKDGRHYFGPHWITSRKEFEKGGAILALLDHNLRWRGAWMDKCDIMHWEWHATKAQAMAWVETMAKSSRAKAP